MLLERMKIICKIYNHEQFYIIIYTSMNKRSKKYEKKIDWTCNVNCMIFGANCKESSTYK